VLEKSEHKITQNKEYSIPNTAWVWNKGPPNWLVRRCRAFKGSAGSQFGSLKYYVVSVNCSESYEFWHLTSFLSGPG